MPEPITTRKLSLGQAIAKGKARGLDALAYDPLPRDTQSHGAYGKDGTYNPNASNLDPKRIVAEPVVTVKAVATPKTIRRFLRGEVDTPTGRVYAGGLLVPSGHARLCPTCGLATSCNCNKAPGTSVAFIATHQTTPVAKRSLSTVQWAIKAARDMKLSRVVEALLDECDGRFYA